MNDRIKAIRKNAGLKQAEFADKIGIKPNTVTSYETGLRVPSDTVILSICREFGVSETWLRTGEGEMYRVQSEDDELGKIFAEVGASNDALIKAILKAYWKLDEKEKAAIRKLIDDLLEHYKKEKPGD